MQLGSLAAVFVVAGIALIARRVRMAVELLAGGLRAYYCASGLKDLIGRGRPADVVSDVVFHGDPARGLGFPIRARRGGGGGGAITGAAVAALGVGAADHGGIRPDLRRAHLPLEVLVGFLLGWTIGAAVHLAFSAPSGRVTADRVRTALQRAGRRGAPGERRRPQPRSWGFSRWHREDRCGACLDPPFGPEPPSDLGLMLDRCLLG
jgi:undecaprenyl-diphosphatase